MHVLSTRDLNSFKTLARMTQYQLQHTVYRMLNKIYPSENVYITKDVVYAIGDIPILLVAHLDTVFPSPPEEIYYDKDAGIMWSPDGLGADDRAGVFSILKILSDNYKPNVLFTTDEESGGIGANNFASTTICPFKDLKYIIELDRNGSLDCVFYDNDNFEFQKYVESFGFAMSYGTYSDIVELCSVWDVSGVNLSIGYKNEHSYIETLNVNHMLMTIEKVKKMLDNPPEEKFEYVSEYDPQIICKCSKCGNVNSIFNMIPVTVDKQNHKTWYCGDCVTADSVEWCNKCYEGFKPGILNKDNICPSCEKIQSRLNNNEFTKSLFKNSTAIQPSNRVQSRNSKSKDEFSF